MNAALLPKLLFVMCAMSAALASGPTNDAALTAALLGTWEVLLSPATPPYGEVTYASDGGFSGYNTAIVQHPDGSVDTKKIRMHGRWRIKDGVLVITALDSEPTGLTSPTPAKRYLIRSITPGEARFKDESTGSELYRRRKGQRVGVTV